MLDTIKTFLIKGVQIILVLVVIWIIYLIAVFFYPNLPSSVAKTLNLENWQNKNATSSDMTFGETIYNMFSDFKFPQPMNREVGTTTTTNAPAYLDEATSTLPDPVMDFQ